MDLFQLYFWGEWTIKNSTERTKHRVGTLARKPGHRERAKQGRREDGGVEKEDGRSQLWEEEVRSWIQGYKKTDGRRQRKVGFYFIDLIFLVFYILICFRRLHRTSDYCAFNSLLHSKSHISFFLRYWNWPIIFFYVSLVVKFCLFSPTWISFFHFIQILKWHNSETIRIY